ncbi:DUF6228 family protein [Actinoplanes sp. NBRC 103695]|uniref:DUF6228 family protein n=1 Tax=Actinoplanes sp. NBRC 103695 TaxID=3032202 RepID=UPI0025563A4C|nr:DUF6228 family protein [Actinoplanes sp. NBRC 103695]
MYRTLDDGIELVADDGQARVRLLGPQRPFADDFVDFRVELQDCGLNAATGVRTIEGDGLRSWTNTLADSYAGWEGEQSWESLERDARISARHDGRGHVTLRFVIRGPRAYDEAAWKASVSVSLDAGEDIVGFAREI